MKHGSYLATVTCAAKEKELRGGRKKVIPRFHGQGYECPPRSAAQGRVCGRVCTCLCALACFYDLPRHFEPRPLRPRHFSIEAHFSQGEMYRSSRACSSMVDARTCVTHSHVTVQSASVTWESPATPLPCPRPAPQDGRGSDSLHHG